MQNQPAVADNRSPHSATESQAAHTATESQTAPPAELRRDVTIWGSFCWGYADVGADVYVALGLVIAAAQGAAPLAFLVA